MFVSIYLPRNFITSSIIFKEPCAKQINVRPRKDWVDWASAYRSHWSGFKSRYVMRDCGSLCCLAAVSLSFAQQQQVYNNKPKHSFTEKSNGLKISIRIRDYLDSLYSTKQWTGDIINKISFLIWKMGNYSLPLCGYKQFCESCNSTSTCSTSLALFNVYIYFTYSHTNRYFTLTFKRINFPWHVFCKISISQNKLRERFLRREIMYIFIQSTPNKSEIWLKAKNQHAWIENRFCWRNQIFKNNQEIHWEESFPPHGFA